MNPVHPANPVILSMNFSRNQVLARSVSAYRPLARYTSRPLRIVIAIVGPTASGKSTLGIEVALQLNGEIINCDSVQVYKEIQIATAKVPLDERKGVPHHLIDFVSPDINYTAVEWAREAAKKSKKSKAAVAFHFSSAAPVSIFAHCDNHSSSVHQLTNHCAGVSIKSAKDVGPNTCTDSSAGSIQSPPDQLYPRDWPRVQRAIEVYLQTGRSIVDQQPERPEPHESSRRLRILALNPPRAELYERINERTEAHFRAGLVEEVRDCYWPAASHPIQTRSARTDTGALSSIYKGLRDLESAIEQTKLDVRHYAKRQLTWFRHEAESSGLTVLVRKTAFCARF